MLKNCLGVQGISSVYGDARFKRDMMDQDYIDTIEAKIRGGEKNILFRMWKFLDFGRSFFRALVLALCIALFYGLLFFMDYLFHFGLLDFSSSADTFLTPFYYSFVTFTTLGFGDVVPSNWVGELIVVTEVIAGFLSLGVMVAIFAQTIARRS